MSELLTFQLFLMGILFSVALIAGFIAFITKPKRYQKIRRDLSRNDWKQIDQIISREVSIDFYRPDAALIDLSIWLNRRLVSLTKGLPKVDRNFRKEWKKKLAKKVRKSVRGTQYLSKKDCTAQELSEEFKTWNMNALVSDSGSINQELTSNLQIKPVNITYHSNLYQFTEEDLVMSLRNDSDMHDEYDLSFEIIKNLPSLHPVLVRYYNQLSSQDDLIPEWKDALVFCEKKKGIRPTLMESVRPLIKLPTVVRLYHKMVSKKMSHFCDKNEIINRELQKGNYRSFSGVQESILLAKEVIKKARDQKRPLSMLFLDIKNAYGSIKKDVIMYAIKHYQMPKDFINYVNVFYSENKAKISIRRDISEPFDWNIGIYQGCSLSNLLFLVSINLILEDINSRYNHLGFKIDQLRMVLMGFVDDLVIVTEKREDLMVIFEHLYQLLTQFGFQLNYSKLKLLELNQDQPDLVLNGHPIERVQSKDNFKYLGSYLTLENKTEGLVEIYLEDLKQVFEKVDQTIVRKNVISDYQKFLVYQRQILPKIRWILISENFTKEEYQKITDLENKYLNKWMPIDNPLNKKRNQEIQETKDQVIAKSKKNIFTLSKDTRIQEISMEKYQTNRPQIEKEREDRLKKISELVDDQYDNLIDFVLDCNDNEFSDLVDQDLDKVEVKRDIVDGKLKYTTYHNAEEYVDMET